MILFLSEYSGLRGGPSQVQVLVQEQTVIVGNVQSCDLNALKLLFSITGSLLFLWLGWGSWPVFLYQFVIDLCWFCTGTESEIFSRALQFGGKGSFPLETELEKEITARSTEKTQSSWKFYKVRKISVYQHNNSHWAVI